MLFILLAVLDRRLEKRLKPGDLFAGYMIGYGVGRFWIEGWFRPDAWRYGPLATAQWISLAMIILGSAFIFWVHRRGRPQEAVATAETEATE
jgi:phosphatidylglycerol:prolipoprotein diacylglycerol transferase